MRVDVYICMNINIDICILVCFGFNKIYDYNLI